MGKLAKTLKGQKTGLHPMGGCGPQESRTPGERGSSIPVNDVPAKGRDYYKTGKQK